MAALEDFEARGAVYEGGGGAGSGLGGGWERRWVELLGYGVHAGGKGVLGCVCMCMYAWTKGETYP